MKKGLLIISFLMCALTVVVSSHATDLIISQGTSYIHDERIDIARDKAVDSALRSAVEQTVGVMISSTTEVVNFEVKLDQILSESKGFINSYKIISEERDGNILKVTVEADIGIGKLRDRMEALKLIMTRKSMPRLMIIFSKGTQADLIAESVMSKYFMTNGFKVIDAETVKKNTKHERLQALASSNNAIKKLGHRYGAEIIIIGGIESSTRSVKVDSIEMQFNKALGSAKAVNVDTGEVIATESDTRSAPGLRAAEKTVIEEIGEKIAESMMDQIIDRWSSELINTVTVKVLVSGIKSYKELTRIKRIIKNEVRGIQQLFQRSYAKDRVELDVEIKGNTQSLADDLAAVKIKGRSIKILEMTQNRLDVKLVP